MSFLSKLFIESFLRGIGKTSGTLITMFVGWQMFKLTNDYQDILGVVSTKRITDNKSEYHEIEHDDIEDIQVDDKEIESKNQFKTILDTL